jgi:hypothetical protein
VIRAFAAPGPSRSRPPVSPEQLVLAAPELEALPVVAQRALALAREGWASQHEPWDVRLLLEAAAAADPAAAGRLADCLHGVVVERGSEAMPVREPLPLTLPAQAAEQMAAQLEQQAQQQGGPSPA